MSNAKTGDAKNIANLRRRVLVVDHNDVITHIVIEHHSHPFVFVKLPMHAVKLPLIAFQAIESATLMKHTVMNTETNRPNSERWRTR